MKVLFSATVVDILQHKETYRTIRQAILDNNAELINDWLEEGINQAMHHPAELDNLSSYYTKVVGNMERADVIIFDATVETMGMGSQITLALSKRKPTLILTGEDNTQMLQTLLNNSKSPHSAVMHYSKVTDIRVIIGHYLNSLTSQQDKHESYPT
jgi:hypothetical protein